MSGKRSGGSWERSVMTQAADAGRASANDGCAVLSRTGTGDTLCKDDGWPRTARIDGMVLQQPCPR